MGGGNAMKSKTARDRKAAKDAKANKGSQLKVNQESMSIVCEICRTQFMCTSKPVILMQHVESKHPKNKPEECFSSLKEGGPSS
jgi:Zinc-binding